MMVGFSGAVVEQGGRRHAEGAVPGVAERDGGGGLDAAAVADLVVAGVAVEAEQPRVDGDGAREPSERRRTPRTAHAHRLRTVTSNTGSYPAFSPVFACSTSTLAAAHFPAAGDDLAAAPNSTASQKQKWMHGVFDQRTPRTGKKDVSYLGSGGGREMQRLGEA